MANYDENLVNAAAEKCWWRYTSKRKLVEEFNLTENQIDELRKTLQYRRRVLELMVAQRPRAEFEKWVNHKPNFSEWLGRRMGLGPEVVSDMVKEARQFHEDIASGKARAPEVIYNPDKVEASEVKEIGKGSESVYLYYFPTYRRYAELLKEPNYPCNVGRTEGVVTNRVSQQIGDQLPEKPQLALILRTDNCRWLEARIHAALKRKGKQIEDAIGEEWFMTAPSEVKSIYLSISGAD
ncbi:MAG: GIY-YIG nuclease family protein [Candidatus Poribacteria bacterium]|nr:GIY-YIG nuclease family protein [Candidatus Poribacteria bacterium]